eukprot:910290-Pyramimonas_sp.AAC.1
MVECAAESAAGADLVRRRRRSWTGGVWGSSAGSDAGWRLSNRWAAALAPSSTKVAAGELWIVRGDSSAPAMDCLSALPITVSHLLRGRSENCLCRLMNP